MPSPIIAVFGSNRPEPGEVDAARGFGRVIAKGGATILSGGRWNPESTQIKDVAATVADDEAPAEKEFPAWLGVANTPAPALPAPDHRGIILSPGRGHERNFAEACLCHAAVVLGTSDGTSSEALFSLFLGRPTVLVNVPVAPAPEDLLRSLRTAAMTRIDPPEDRNPIRRGIRSAYDWAQKARDLSLWRVQLPASDDVYDAIIDRLLVSVGDPSPRPAWDTLTDAAAWERFVESALRERIQPIIEPDIGG